MQTLQWAHQLCSANLPYFATLSDAVHTKAHCLSECALQARASISTRAQQLVDTTKDLAQSTIQVAQEATLHPLVLVEKTFTKASEVTHETWETAQQLSKKTLSSVSSIPQHTRQYACEVSAKTKGVLTRVSSLAEERLASAKRHSDAPHRQMLWLLTQPVTDLKAILEAQMEVLKSCFERVNDVLSSNPHLLPIKAVLLRLWEWVNEQQAHTKTQLIQKVVACAELIQWLATSSQDLVQEKKNQCLMAVDSFSHRDSVQHVRRKVREYREQALQRCRSLNERKKDGVAYASRLAGQYHAEWILPVTSLVRAVTLVSKELIQECVSKQMEELLMTYEISKDRVTMLFGGTFDKGAFTTEILEKLADLKDITVETAKEGLKIQFDRAIFKENSQAILQKVMEVVKETKAKGKVKLAEAKRTTLRTYRSVLERIRQRQQELLSREAPGRMLAIKAGEGEELLA